MVTLKASEARTKLFRLMDELSASHEPVQVIGKRSSVVIISADDWRSLEETLYLLSIPGMRASIRKGLKTPVSRCSKELNW
jgi:antitoxin YefM